MAQIVLALLVMSIGQGALAEISEADRNAITVLVAKEYSSDIVAIEFPAKIPPLKKDLSDNENTRRLLQGIIDRNNRTINVWVRRTDTKDPPHLMKFIKENCVWTSTGYERIIRN